jgi:hypothetical protein
MSELHALPLKAPRPWAKRLGFSAAALLLLAYGLPYSQPLFAALFPLLPRPVYSYVLQGANGGVIAADFLIGFMADVPHNRLHH